ncbi:hypothetical protein EMIHUDRAFT_212516 [Emiliania huxleyi CCMP1516]|uniref:EamA domain-containing protein n=2 Tax=Emiliania huxleyi TaxID=2903 RepID=A0A0D3IQB8_EMIH1|nr:hypothetical protein EMIHUDRAFT_212516 [Emiliania huxleyi CCMP1516]EOD13453.1 hypothetical protein EMIHUDRAFT_212516 [Emiliania huxleyi CCMP1516]|eukprot:XP_005765882.1 hypothetical protein EMIHUDRAFT_212516 [Emiliania huxleyi CCMP1516]
MPLALAIAAASLTLSGPRNAEQDRRSLAQAGSHNCAEAAVAAAMRRPTATVRHAPAVLTAAVTSPPPARRAMPLAMLLLAPLAMGTYGVAVKCLFALPTPPPELLFTLINYLVSSTAVAAAATVVHRRDLSPSAPRPPRPGSRGALLAGGCELGGYLFLGSCFQLFGLRTVPASRAAFLIQLTTVFTPLVDGLLQRRAPSRAESLGCLLALCGVAMLLARVKEAARGLLSLAALAAAAACSPAQAQGLRAFAQAAAARPRAVAGPVLALAMWTGLVTTALPTVAQTLAQRDVAASTAAVAYAAQPLVSADAPPSSFVPTRAARALPVLSGHGHSRGWAREE